MSSLQSPGTLTDGELSKSTPQHREEEVVDLDTSLGEKKDVGSPYGNEKEKDVSPFDNESGNEEEEEEAKVEITIPEKGKFIDDKSVKVDLKSDDEGDDTPTLPLNKKNKKEIGESKIKKKEKPSMYLFPILRLKLAWTGSSNIIEFIFKAIAIIFSTLGWLCCVGGVPLMSLAMLIIGSIYIDDCKIQPNIPVYLVVSGVFGTLQHFMAVWTKYIPKDSQGRLKTYRAYCVVVDCIIHLFMSIWFVLGCIWVYGVHSQVDFKDSYKDEYCDKVLYLFAFWILNISFILLTILIACTFCCIVFIVATPKEEDVEMAQ